MPRNILGLNGVSDDILNVARAQFSAGQANSELIEKDAKADGPSGTTIQVKGTGSIFNPLYVFRYSEFGAGANASTPGAYDLERHKLNYENSLGALDKIRAAADRLARRTAAVVQNPTAVAIKTWSDTQGALGSNHKGPLYPYPYALSDFTQCKWYGKIPNNRLLTLRRYPIPVEDNLQAHQDKLPLIPIAQAVSWWGGDTGNKLSELLGMTYAFNWKKYPATDAELVQDVSGNEIQLESLLDAAGITNETARKAIITSFGNIDGGNPFAMSGFDKTLQENYKNQWATGAYSNRIYGPLNVITETQIRDRGYDFTHEIKIDFEYKLRTISNLNPKVVMLDLISNFLSLTYNRASFWGGSYRYFQQTGALLPGFNTDAMEKGDYAEAAKQITSMLSQLVQTGGAELKKFFTDVSSTAAKPGDFGDKIGSIVEKFTGSTVGNNIISSRIGNLHQTPLVMRALADGRAVGEWHLMVGNPMDPLAVIGNLILKSTKIEFSDELGADDFPTGVKFTVTLDHGRPRAKQDIESMFNHGGGDMFFTAIQPPASARNSYGEANSKMAVNANGEQITTTPLSGANALTSAQAIQQDQRSEEAMTGAVELANYFKPGVSRAYGEGFGNSKILPDYFLKLYTAD
jgi:hypothetical protein